MVPELPAKPLNVEPFASRCKQSCRTTPTMLVATAIAWLDEQWLRVDQWIHDQ